MDKLTGPWSYSRTSMCPLAAKLKYIDRVPGSRRPAHMLDIDRTLMGSALHHGADLCLGRVMDGKPMPEDMGKFVREEILTFEEGGKKIFAPLIDEIGELINRLEIFQARFGYDVDAGIDDAELRDDHIRETCLGHELLMAMDGKGGIVPYEKCPEDGWRGKIDYVATVPGHPNRLRFRDYKNSPYILSPEEVRTHEQLSTYCRLLMAEYPDIEEFDIGIYIFAYGIEVSAVIKRWQVEKNFANVVARARALAETTEYIPVPGHGRCQYCDYINECDAGTEAVSDMSRASMTELAQWVYKTEEKLSRAKKELLGFVRENESIYIDDQGSFYGYSLPANPSYDWNKEDGIATLKELVKENKIKGPLVQYFSLDTRKLNSLCKKSPELTSSFANARTMKLKPKIGFGREKTSVPVKVEKKGRSILVSEDDLKSYKTKVEVG